MSASTPKTPIPVFRPHVPAAVRRRLERALDSGWLGYGPECLALESAFTSRHGGWALATSSCTSALYLAGRLIHASSDVDQPEIIVPAVTFVASAVAFLQAGVKPVLGESIAMSIASPPPPTRPCCPGATERSSTLSWRCGAWPSTSSLQPPEACPSLRSGPPTARCA
jgi:hypothetical protein